MAISQETQILIRDSYINLLTGKISALTSDVESHLRKNVHFLDKDLVVKAITNYRRNKGFIKIGYKEYHNLNMLVLLCGRGPYGIIYRDLDNEIENLSTMRTIYAEHFRRTISK